MRQRSMFALVLAAILLPVPPAHAAPESQGEKSKEVPATSPGGIQMFQQGDRVLRYDNSGKGAILCTWSIFETIRAVGQECYKGQDTAFQAELDRSMERIDEFIIKNSKHPVTRAEIEAERAQNLQKLRSGWYMCIGYGPRMYEDLRKKGPETLNVQTTNLLSIPREPVMNPCM